MLFASLKQECKNFLCSKDTKELALIAIILLSIRTFLFGLFVVPSSSMYPTLLIGDYIIASKTIYGYSNHTFPFSPNLFSGRILSDHRPKTGDVIVFRMPQDDHKDYVKRVIGQPGDTVQMVQGVLYINGIESKLKKVGDFEGLNDQQKQIRTAQYEETLPNGKVHPILKAYPFGSRQYDNTPKYIVPEKHYFVMGDNRDFSADSRIQFRVDHSNVGFVSEDQLIGHADLIWFSTSAKWWQPHKWLTSLRLKRFFTWVS